MDNSLDDYISTIEAKKLTGYTRQHITNLVKRGKVEGKLIKGRWLVSHQSILDYKAQQDKISQWSTSSKPVTVGLIEPEDKRNGQQNKKPGGLDPAFYHRRRNHLKIRGKKQP